MACKISSSAKKNNSLCVQSAHIVDFSSLICVLKSGRKMENVEHVALVVVLFNCNENNV